MPITDELKNSETEDKQIECIEQLRKLMKDDKNLKNLKSDNEYLSRFLYSCDFNVEEAYQRMKTFYELLLEFPDWFTTDGPVAKRYLIEKNMRYVIPEKDNEGRPLYIARVGNAETSMTVQEIISVDDIWLEYILMDEAVKEKGLCVIIDIKGFSWQMLKWLTPHNVNVATKKLEVFPIKEYRFHIVNSTFVVKAGIKLIWPFLSDRIKEMVKFHFNNFNALYEYIQPEKLPKEYGGKYEVNINECFTKLFEKNDEIAKRLKVNRTIY